MACGDTLQGQRVLGNGDAVIGTNRVPYSKHSLMQIEGFDVITLLYQVPHLNARAWKCG